MRIKLLNGPLHGQEINLAESEFIELRQGNKLYKYRMPEHAMFVEEKDLEIRSDGSEQRTGAKDSPRTRE